MIQKLLNKITNQINIFFNRTKWKKFRKLHLDSDYNEPDYLTEKDKQNIDFKESKLQEIIKKYCPQSFLEIGIGGEPIISRMQLFNDLNISYTGCDFQHICDKHVSILTQEEIHQKNISFLGNINGTYSWNLFELVQKNSRFDMIYIDGHHTFYIDFPAFILSDFLLHENGYLLIDDVTWTLKFMKRVMGRFFWQWHLYKDAYNFQDYSSKQQNIPHIKMITEKIMIEKLGYIKLNEFSDNEWYILQKTSI